MDDNGSYTNDIHLHDFKSTNYSSGAISPLPCNVMPFGCCWDGFTYATGKNQKGCPGNNALVCSISRALAHVTPSGSRKYSEDNNSSSDLKSLP